MTFNVTVPNAAQSPGLFPAQNNTNNQRVKDIINADHNFVDTFAANQGAHKQVTYINRAVPGSLTAGTNGVGYTKDVNGIPQLYFYNGVTDHQITPPLERYAATLTLASGATSAAILTMPDAAQATIAVFSQTQSTFKYYMVFRVNNVANVVVSFMNGTNSLSIADVVTIANVPITQVALKNNSASTATFFYSIMLNRL